ncbi:MAG: glycosyltransferase [Bacteroidota bacterium]
MTKQSTPLVSICCLAYNHEKFLRTAVDSFLMQKTTFPFEIIIHDDASTDGTAEIIREYHEKHPGIIVPILQTENQYSKGVRPSPTFVWPKARGRYIALCEGDDYWTDPLKLQKQIDLLETETRFSACFHETKQLDDSGAEGRTFGKGTPEILGTEETFVPLSPLHTSSIVFRNILGTLPEWFSTVVSADMALFSILSAHGPLKKISGTMSVYRKHPQGITNRQTNKERYHHQRIELMNHLNAFHQFRFDSAARRVIELHLRTIEQERSAQLSATAASGNAVAKDISMSKDTVIIVTGGFPVISETFILDQITGYIDRGKDVEIWAFEKTGQKTVHPAINSYGLTEKVKYLSLPAHGTADPNIWQKKFYELNRVTRIEDAGNVHIHFGPNFNMLASLFYLNPEVPTIVSFHGYDASKYIKEAGKGCYDFLFARADVITTPSEYMKKKLVDHGCSPEKISIHRYGVNLSLFKVNPNKNNGKNIKLLSVSRLVEKKGLEYSISALSKIKERSNVHYTIIGEGPLHTSLTGLIATLGLQKNVEIVPFKDQQGVLQAMSETDIFVLTSVTAADGDQEGMPVSLVEAHAMGLPVVSTVHAGIPELVEHGVTGLLCKEKNVDQIAESMSALINDEQLRRTFSLQARIRAEKEFNIERQNDKLIKHFAEIRSRHSSAPFISICIPTYNRSEYLRDAIYSALTQSYPNFEIVVADDGSTDNTAEMVAGFQNDKIAYYKKEHSGAPATRNYAVSKAKGAYIVWLDSDDLLERTALESHVAVLTKYPETDVIYGHITITDKNKKKYQRLEYRDWSNDRKHLLAQLLLTNPIPNPGTMVKKSAYRKAGLYNTEFIRAHDYEWWSRAVPLLNFKLNDSDVCLWRQHGGNLGAGSNKKVDYSYEVKIIHALIKTHGIQALFPDKEWTSASRHKDMFTALMKLSVLCSGYGSTELAIKYAEKALTHGPNKEAEEYLQKLKALVETSGRSSTVQTTEDPLRICYLINSILGVTGGNQTLLKQINAMVRKGHSVSIVTYTDRPAFMKILAEVVKVPQGESMAQYVPDCDVVVGTYFLNALELKNVKAKSKVYFAQGDQFVFEDTSAELTGAQRKQLQEWKQLSKESYLQNDVKFIANSRNLAGAVEQQYGRKADAIVPVCVDQTIFRPLQRSLLNKRPRILIVGPDMNGSAMEPLTFKGIGDIRKALEKLTAKGIEFTAVRMSNSHPEIFKDFPCEFYAVPSDELKTFLYGTATILVYASHYDSCPIPPLEAMAAGAAVVCTASNGAKEYCRHEENALMVPVKSPDELCAAIERLLNDAELRERLIRGGFATARQFPREREWNEMEQLFISYARSGKPQKPEVSGNAKVLLETIASLFEQKEWSKSLDSITQFQEQFPECWQNDGEMQELLAQFKGLNHLNLQQLNEAKAAFEFALNVNPRSSEACAGLGEVLYQAEMDDESKKMFEWAVVNDTENINARKGLAKVNTALQLPGGDNSLLDPRITSLIEQAEDLINVGDIERAEDILGKVFASDKYHVDALNDLSVCRIMKKEISNAVEILSLVLTIDPANETAQENLRMLNGQPLEIVEE